MDNENYILKIVSLIVFRKKDVGLFHFSYLTNLFLMLNGFISPGIYPHPAFD